MQNTVTKAAPISWSILLPLALAQFICSYAATTMNVSISVIAKDLGTDVHAIQITITFFTLTMAALMIPGSKLTDIWGRKFCLMLGLIVYGLGALIATFAQGIGLLMFGYSLLEGVGTALLIPPVYILCTVSFLDLPTRARAFGVISAAGGIGAAAGPLIGGVITTTISWRASFALQVLVVALIIVLSRRLADPGVQGAKPKFDIIGTILSAAGLVFVVLGILQAGTYGWITASQNFTIGNTVVIPQGGISPVWLFVGIGALFLVGFFFWIRSRERAGKEPLLSTRLFHNRTSNLGLVTQLIQWFIIQGSFFVISVYLQEVHHYNAIQTGLALTPTTIGILIAGALAGRLAQRRTQKRLIWAGFVLTIVGMILLLLLAGLTSSSLASIPGLLLLGLGVGTMLTSSVNVVQSSFPDKEQGEISGLSRSASNLGSSLGTAIAGSVLVTTLVQPDKTYPLALITMIVFACIGLIAALLLPNSQKLQTTS
ncbi:MAG: MFS transporter [Chloroflexi bacterium]|jgi:MFS family permease|nr:MAG: MFS transporter [Ktedonobacter sp. 13_2_20CM_2_54_8]OLE31087.1 MAG: MFS transporter [Ktedonobacter sp. 13_1_20CM_3_54_15]TMC21521.1 MAG: MFS transporter [Chloroflexota bacterium]TMD34279.1 MAG: MFS transporter [Chloroflexota bacterium]TME61690.1 MAG: MFS transporter [Chloroflexota bacterium]